MVIVCILCCFYSGCTLCPEQTVGLVQYPATPSPEDGSITVMAECVANAVVLSHNLSVTCNSVGDWGNENPQCKCVESQIDENTCSGMDIIMVV